LAADDFERLLAEETKRLEEEDGTGVKRKREDEVEVIGDDKKLKGIPKPATPFKLEHDTVALKYGPPPDHTENHRPTKYDEIKGAILDKEGEFKYIQIFVKDTRTFKTKTVVRGYKNCDSHIEIL
jgi:hypothetical protein